MEMRMKGVWMYGWMSCGFDVGLEISSDMCSCNHIIYRNLLC